MTPDTTADGAAGIFGLYLMGDTPTADQVLFVLKKANVENQFPAHKNYNCNLCFGSVQTKISNRSVLK